MAGVKGRTGRRPNKQVLKVEYVLKLCEDHLIRVLTHPNTKEEKKTEIAKILYPKAIASRIDHNFSDDVMDFVIRMPSKKPVGADVE